MANKKHVDILEKGASVWNRWRKENSHIEPDLSYAILRNMDLCHADLSKANLNHANFAGSDLSKANLSYSAIYGALLHRSCLNKANLKRANLSGVCLTGAEIIGANLQQSYLGETNFNDADLDESDFSEAILFRTVFGNNDLSKVKGLDAVTHQGPSIIGIETIYRSMGKISDVFLRNAGVPENFITCLPSLSGAAFQFFSCFISHSSKDKRFCDRLHADLRAKGVRCWYFPQDAKWGETLWKEIDRSIKLYDKLIVVCSKNSLQSGPVLREIERALIREDREGKNVLFPIRIDNYIFDEWQHERKDDLIHKIVGDFKGWNRSRKKYFDSFDKLIESLQAE